MNIEKYFVLQDFSAKCYEVLLQINSKLRAQIAQNKEIKSCLKKLVKNNQNTTKKGENSGQAFALEDKGLNQYIPVGTVNLLELPGNDPAIFGRNVMRQLYEPEEIMDNILSPQKAHGDSKNRKRTLASPTRKSYLKGKYTVLI